jgi:hypothetical protein
MFFACAGTSSAAVIYTANRLPGMSGQDFTTIGEALDYVTRNGYFILEGNDPFEGINADSLAFDVDASKMSSYPQINATWYDLSGNQNSGTLTNGPVWVSSSGSFSFDGIDDYVEVSNNDGFGTAGIAPVATLSFTANLQRKAGGGTQFQQVAGFRNGGTYEFFFLLLDASGATVNTEARLGTSGGVYDINVNFTPYFDKWTRVDFVTNSNRTDLYFNSNLVGSNTSVSGIFQATSGPFRIGLSPSAQFPTKGLIQDTRFYSRALSQTEIKQNYFGSPIVTDGLVFAVDANNIVSYPKSGTAWYGLTGSYSASLVNGPTFDPSNGGSIVFDGVDDQVTTNAPGQSTATLMAWVYPYTSSNEPSGYFEGIIDNDTPGFYGQGFGPNGSTYAAILDDTFWGTGVTVDLNAWQLVAMSFNSNTAKFYKNGVEAASFSYTQGTLTSTNYLIGKSNANAEYFNGRIANVKIYNRVLTASEIQQNYQAEQYRFETPAGPVTNGLVAYWDAGNLDSYPGTGTTWYNLAGSINGTLTNGVGFNQINGGILTFDGVDDFIQYTSLLNVGNTFTVNCWIKPTANTRQTIVSNGYPYSTNKGFFMVCPGNNATELFISLGQDQKFAISGTGMITTGAWQMVTARVNGASELIKLYVNGVETTYSSQTDADITLQYDTGVFTTGCRNGVAASDRLYSNFATLQIYNRALSTTEITQNYNFFKGRFGL